jgi:hypothetical protein
MNFMKDKFPTFVFAILVFCCSGIVAQPQQSPVKVEFKVDEKATNKRIRIILYANGVATEPAVSNEGTFIFPSLADEWVDVRLISGKYDLLYSHIYLNKLRGPLIFRVFTSRRLLRTEREQHAKTTDQLASNNSDSCRSVPVNVGHGASRVRHCC